MKKVKLHSWPGKILCDKVLENLIFKGRAILYIFSKGEGKARRGRGFAVSEPAGQLIAAAWPGFRRSVGVESGF
jgi:hypothetical protein